MPFDLRVGHLYGRLPSCIVLIPLRPATEMLGARSRCTRFLSWEMAFGVPNSPFFPAARAGYIESAS